MITKQSLGIIGSIILFVGVFTPIVSIPILGNMNYFQNGKGDGTVVLIFAGISLVLALAKKYKGLWFTGIGSLGIMLFTFINFQIGMSQVKNQMESELAGNPFRGLADIAMQTVQLQWGWAILVVGAGLIIAAAALKNNSLVLEPAEPIKEIKDSLQKSKEQVESSQIEPAQKKATDNAWIICSILLAVFAVGFGLYLLINGVHKLNPSFETVELAEVPNSDNLVKIILQYGEIEPEYAKDWFMVSRFDINNDGELDILYTYGAYTGSCGYTWNILINKGGGKYEISKCVIGCVGKILAFSNETVKGLRIPYSMGEKQEYSCRD